MNFGQLDITEKEKVFINKYVEYGNQELMITGFEMKASKAGDKHQIEMKVESPTITTEGFTPDEKAINGGKVGSIKVGIYANYTEFEEAKKIATICQSIAKRVDEGTYSKVCAIEAADMQTYLYTFAALMKGKFVWFTVCAEAYGTKTSEKTGKTYDKYTLNLGRYKYVGSSESDLAPFDKTNKYHYGYTDTYSATPDAPSTPVTTTTGSTPWN